MSGLNVVPFPDRDLSDIPSALRRIADGIEKGEYGDAHNLAWVIDKGNSEIDVGLCGHSAEPGAVAHYLFALGQRNLENVKG
mgnify:CR=1 FL=1